MKRLTIDIETFSPLPLAKCGVYKYSESVEVLIVTWAWNDDPVTTWDMTAGDATLDDVQALLDAADEVLIHNANFERTVFAAVGLTMPIEKVRCSMVLALQHSLPGALGQLCDVLNVPVDAAKDKDGKKLINLFCKPRAKNVKLRRATRETHPDDWQRFLGYAALDVDACRAVYARIPRWNDTDGERRLWRLDQAVNDAGVRIDLGLADAALRAFQRASGALAAAASDMTGGAVGSTTQRARLLGHLSEAHGFDTPDLTKGTVERLLRDDNLSSEVRDLLLNRQQASATSPAKYQALLLATCADGRLRGTIQFAGASRTQRDAGRIFQPQNLPRTPDWFTPEKQEIAVEALKAECEELFFDSTVEIVSYCVRGALVPKDEHKLVVADLSNIEGRVLAWLAGEDWKIEAFKAYDRGEGPDIYKATAGRILGKPATEVTKAERQLEGKVSELAGGFGGGLGAFRRMGGEKLDALSDDRVMEIVKQWRASHPATVRFWYALERAARDAIANVGSSYTVRDVTFDARHDDFGNLWLRLRKPNGNYLCYFRPEVTRDECYTCNGSGTVLWEDRGLPCHECGGSGMAAGRGQITYEGVDQYTRQWKRLETYYGRLVENLVQSVARDVFMAGFERAMAEGYWVVLRVHDELVCEVPARQDFTGRHLADLMATHTSWTTGLPLAAAGDEMMRYCKA